jgi:hypothetical protein
VSHRPRFGRRRRVLLLKQQRVFQFGYLGPAPHHLLKVEAVKLGLFRFLKVGLAVILVFIGLKMLVEHWMKVSTTTSLAVIAGVLTTSILMSVLIKQPNKAK